MRVMSAQCVQILCLLCCICTSVFIVCGVCAPYSCSVCACLVCVLFLCVVFERLYLCPGARLLSACCMCVLCSCVRCICTRVFCVSIVCALLCAYVLSACCVYARVRLFVYVCFICTGVFVCVPVLVFCLCVHPYVACAPPETTSYVALVRKGHRLSKGATVITQGKRMARMQQ